MRITSLVLFVYTHVLILPIQFAVQYVFKRKIIRGVYFGTSSFLPGLFVLFSNIGLFCGNNEFLFVPSLSEKITYMKCVPARIFYSYSLYSTIIENIALHAISQ